MTDTEVTLMPVPVTSTATSTATDTDNPDDQDIPVDLDTITVINDWTVTHIGHRDHNERELALAIAERNRTQRTSRTTRRAA